MGWAKPPKPGNDLAMPQILHCVSSLQSPAYVERYELKCGPGPWNHCNKGGRANRELETKKISAKPRKAQEVWDEISSPLDFDADFVVVRQTLPGWSWHCVSYCLIVLAFKQQTAPHFEVGCRRAASIARPTDFLKQLSVFWCNLPLPKCSIISMAHRPEPTLALHLKE